MALLIFLFNIMDGHELKKKLGEVVLRTGIMRRKAEDDGTKTSLTWTRSELRPICSSSPCLCLTHHLGHVLPSINKVCQNNIHAFMVLAIFKWIPV